MARTGRPPVLDAEKKAKVLEVVGAGFPIRYAARYVGCDEGTIRHAGQRDPEFYDQVKYAQFKAEYDLVKNIRSASESGKNWRAAAWSLERLFPDRYGPHRRDEITNEHIVQISRTYLAIVKRRVPDPLREEVIKEMRRASAEMMIGSAVHTVEDNARSGGLPEEFVPPYWYPEDLRGEEWGEDAPAGAAPAIGDVASQEGDRRQESEARRAGDDRLAAAEQVPAAPAAVEAVARRPAAGEGVAAPSVAAEQVTTPPATDGQIGHPLAEGGQETGDRKRQSTTPAFAEIAVSAPASVESVPSAPALAGRSPVAPPAAEQVPASGQPAEVPPGALRPAEQVRGARDAAEQVDRAEAERRRGNTPAPPAEQVHAIIGVAIGGVGGEPRPGRGVHAVAAKAKVL
jgi:hypothetical protein